MEQEYEEQLHALLPCSDWKKLSTIRSEARDLLSSIRGYIIILQQRHDEIELLPDGYAHYLQHIAAAERRLSLLISVMTE
jgi:hypothetical protein